jgi:hypothetical protein
VSLNSQVDSDNQTLTKINQNTASTFTANPTPSSSYNISQQTNQYISQNKPQTQSYNSTLNQQNFMMQQQTNTNFPRNNQGYIDNYQQQKQMPINRMGMQANINTNSTMFNMNNNGSFINNHQQRLQMNQQQMSMAQPNSIYQQQHNIPFNGNANLNQYQSHSFHHQHTHMNMNQGVFPHGQSVNLMNQTQMQLQPSKEIFIILKN